MVKQSAFQVSFDFLTSKAVVVEPGAAQVSSDAGLLPFRQLDERLGLTQQFAEALRDRRHGGYLDHTFLEMTRMRVYGILADYPDQNDHDVLRSDPIFKLLCDRSTADGDLASQPTLSRFENAIDTRIVLPAARRVDRPVPGRLFRASPAPDLGHRPLRRRHARPTAIDLLSRLLRPVPIPAAGHHLRRERTGADVCLLYGTAHAALGAEDDVEYVVRRLREAWPDVRIHVRGDSGLGVPRMYAVCERLDIDYTLGMGMNARLKKLTEPLLAEAVARREATGEAQRMFAAFWYRAESWPAQRWVIVQCEANAEGTNRRAVVTNRPGALVLPGAAYDGYADRGESENRNKELKAGLQADRLSDHRYFANLFRLYLHTAAYNLLVHMRQAVADPPPPLPANGDVPVEALGRPSTPLLAQSPSRARSAGRRPALHLADAT